MYKRNGNLLHGALKGNLRPGHFAFHHFQHFHDFFVEIRLQCDGERCVNVAAFHLALVVPLQLVIRLRRDGFRNFLVESNDRQNKSEEQD